MAVERQRMGRWRAVAVWSLVVVATILLLVTTLTLWTKRELLDTDAWVDSSSRLLENDQVRTALSVKINDALFERLDLTADLQKKLPKQAQAAAPVIASTIQNGSARAIESFLATPRAQTLWQNVNRRAHTALVKVLEGKPAGPLNTDNQGNVILDLRPLVDRVASRLGIESAVQARASPGSGQIVILKSEDLATAKKAVKVLRALTLFLLLVVLLLYALAVFLARGRRRVVFESVGAAVFLVGLLLLVARRIVGNVLIDSLVKTDANQPAANSGWLILTELLRDVALALVSYGLLMVLAGFLGGPSRAATWIRRELAPTFRRGPWVLHGVGLALFLIVIAWGPTGATRQLIGILILGALFFFGLEVWRRMTIREFPGDDSAAAPPPAATSPTPP